MSEQPSAAVVLAAGLGTRMRSRTPKVLHPVAGTPMIDLLLESLHRAGLQRVYVIVNPAQPEVADHLHGRAELVAQPEARGSGDALGRVPPAALAGDLLVVNGDSPLIRPDTLARVWRRHRESGAAATLLTVVDPSRPDGRVIRDAEGRFAGIVEAKDAAPEQLALHPEVNVGVYCFRGADLAAVLPQLRPDNSAGELYLTDLFRHLRPVELVAAPDAEEAIGINDRVQLARAEASFRRRILEDLMRAGVTISDPASCFVDAGVEVGQDTVLEPFTFLRGATSVGSRCRIGPYSDIRDSTIGDDARIEHAWLQSVEFGSGSDCGPFVKLRPGTRVGPGVHIGSFAELVRTSVGTGSAVPHVAYLGDTTVGENVNVGAGTITANYDGKQKNPTVIEDDCFVGVDTMLVAPRRLGKGSRTGAGAVVTKDVPPGAIAVGVPARALRQGRED